MKTNRSCDIDHLAIVLSIIMHQAMLLHPIQSIADSTKRQKRKYANCTILISLCLRVLEYLLTCITCKGVKLRNVITFLNQTLQQTHLKYDIHNLYAAIKQQKLLSLPLTNALLADIKACGIHYNKKVNQDNRVNSLFIRYLKSIKLAKTNQDIILADCIYKTNKYKLLLLYIVGKCSFILSQVQVLLISCIQVLTYIQPISTFYNSC